MAEIEFSVLSRACLKQRLPDEEALGREVQDERYCDVLRWNEGLDGWGWLRQDRSIVCIYVNGIACSA